jgi:hypothetical protein
VKFFIYLYEKSEKVLGGCKTKFNSMEERSKLIELLLKMIESGELSEKNLKRANEAIELANKEEQPENGENKSFFKDAVILAIKIYLEWIN